MTMITNKMRSKGDPRILRSGPKVLPAADRMARGLGWLGIGLGLMEVMAAPRLARALGMRGNEGLIRSYGVREIGSGLLCLSVDNRAGLWSRVAGDALDLATLRRGLHPGNRRRGNVALALLFVAGVTALDVIALRSARTLHSRGQDEPLDYSDRSGFPGGVAAARGVARGQALNPAAAAV